MTVATHASERRHILQHAGTVLVGQLAVMAFGITDTIVAGRHSQEALAALSVGSAVYISVFVGLMGVLQALLPLWAELHGAHRHRDLGRSVRQSLYLAVALIVLGAGLLTQPDAALAWTQVPDVLRQEVKGYLWVLAWALPPALFFRMYSTLSQAMQLPKLVTRLQLGGLALKVPLSMWWAWGGWGVPALGAEGCAWATLWVNYSMFGVALWTLRKHPSYARCDLWRALEAPDRHELQRFLAQGIPAGLSIMVEVTSFTLMALFVARLGTHATASHQIAANLAAVLYMVPLSIAIATSARTSYWLGAGQPEQARRTISKGFGLVVSGALSFSAIVFIANNQIPLLYTHAPEVAQLASTLLPWVALYHLFDGVQTLCVFVLRCFKITTVTLVVYSVMLWGIGLGGGYGLAYMGAAQLPPWQSPAAFWAASAIALACSAAIFTPLLWQVAYRRR